MVDLPDIDQLLSPAIDAFKERAQSAIDKTIRQMENVLRVTYRPDASVAPEGCPSPRLQLRWVHGEYGGRTCYYEFVFPLKTLDIRNDDDAENPAICVIQLGRTNVSGDEDCRPLSKRAPYRDGAHAQWDAPHFGNPPIYIIGPDGSFALFEAPPQ